MQPRITIFTFSMALIFGCALKAQTLPLGTVTDVQNVSCPGGFAAGSVCQHLTIQGCQETSDAGVTIGTLQGRAGTIALFSGSTGTRPTGGSFVSDYQKAGYTVIDTDWDPPGWENTGETADVLKGACRGATLLNYLASNSNGLFCAQGSSAGSAEIAYAMSWYGVDSKLDAVELLSGPVMSDMDRGCRVPDAPPVTVVPTNGEPFTNAPQYVAQFITAITKFTGQSCQPPWPTSSGVDTSWLDQSIVQPATPKLAFLSSVSGWLCDNGLNNSAAQGAIFYQSLGSSYSLTRISSCMGSEGVAQGVTPQGVNGQVAIESDMESRCVSKR